MGVMRVEEAEELSKVAWPRCSSCQQQSRKRTPVDVRVGLGLATVQTPAATHYSFSDPKGPSTRHFEIFSSVLTMILRKWKCITN